jgi:hypothetical protein
MHSVRSKTTTGPSDDVESGGDDLCDDTLPQSDAAVVTGFRRKAPDPGLPDEPSVSTDVSAKRRSPHLGKSSN